MSFPASKVVDYFRNVDNRSIMAPDKAIFDAHIVKIITVTEVSEASKSAQIQEHKKARQGFP